MFQKGSHSSPNRNYDMEQFLIHNYANLKTPVELNLKDFQNFIYLYGSGQDRFQQIGVSGHIFSMTLDGKRYYACFSKYEKENFLNELYIYHNDMEKVKDDASLLNRIRGGHIKGIPLLFDEDIIIPNNSIFSRICDNINIHISQIRDALNKCCEGQVPYNYIEDYFENAKKLNHLTICRNQWNSYIGLDSNVTDGFDLDIIDYINFNGMLQPIIAPDNTKLEYSKKCMNCGTYYQAKGEKAVFCSEACRSSYRRKMKKEKARPPTS